MPRKLQMPTVSGPAQHRFGIGLAPKIRRSVFNRSHPHKLTCDAGYLIPILVDPVIPGDTFSLKTTIFGRLTTPLRPVQDNMYCETFFFFVPLRQIWANYRKFFGEQDNPADSVSYVLPSIAVPFTPSVGRLFDYLGIMTQATATVIQTPNLVNSLPVRAYWRIYNEWFRDENLINSTYWSLSNPAAGDGPDSFLGSDYPAKRGKRFDYFTSLLPWLQKQTAPLIPAGSVIMAGVTGETAAVLNAAGVQRNLEVVGAAPSPVVMDSAGGGITLTTTGFDINALRQGIAIQTLLERDARGGTRYTEIVREHFGVESDDLRLQRPQYLGGGSTPVVVSPIAQTAQTVGAPTNPATPLGTLGGYGTVTAFGHGFHASFKEHGYVIGIMNFRADLTYQQGVERDWFKQTRYDLFWPELAHIGEQSVLSREIWFDGTTAANAADVGVLGYGPRYEEYRFKNARISGLFRSNAAGTVDIWHLSEDFATRPVLGQTFIEDQTSSILTRVLATPTEPDFYVDIWFDYKCARPIPTFGVPGWGSRPF